MRNKKIHIGSIDNIAISRIKSINRVTNIVLLILWAGALLLTGFMVFRWQNVSTGSEKAEDLFIDDVLLSSGDLELKYTASLINITLNTEKSPTNVQHKQNTKNTEVAVNESSRKILYDKILKQKINKAQKNSSDGFTIKPLPE